MSNKILPFPLVMKNGVKVRTIEELRANADIESIVSFYLNGKLDRWCKAFHYDDIPNELDEITEAMIWQVLESLGITFTQAEVDAYLKERNEKKNGATDIVDVEKKKEKTTVEMDVNDNREIKSKLSEYVKAEINLDNYAVDANPINNEDGYVCQYKVVIKNKQKNIYCSLPLAYTPTDDVNVKEKWYQNMYLNIANAIKNMEWKEASNNKKKHFHISCDFIFVKGNENISDFFICDHPVTQAEFESIMGKNPSHFTFNGKNRPVERVSWYAAIRYCNKRSEKEGLTPYYKIDKENKDPNNHNEDDEKKWTVTRNESTDGYRLLTSAEWEYAAKGGNVSKGNKYSGSDNINEASWYNDNSDRETHSIKEKTLNELGIYDMSGNVWEWCWDWWQDKDDYDIDEICKDYAGPKSGKLRVSRGGSWENWSDSCLISYISKDSADKRSNSQGFRVARSVKY